MEHSDSRRIKEIRDNTAKMADAFTRIADALERLADRKTENSSEKPNNCEDEPLTCDGNCWMKKQNGEWLCEHCQRKPQTEPTGYNLTPVDKDINVRSKDEPQTEYDKYREKIRPHDPHKDWFETEP